MQQLLVDLNLQKGMRKHDEVCMKVTSVFVVGGGGLGERSALSADVPHGPRTVGVKGVKGVVGVVGVTAADQAR